MRTIGQGRHLPLVPLAMVAVGLGGLLWQEAPRVFARLSRPAAQDVTRVPATRFPFCGGPDRYTCVIDGDTFWLEGEKIRIADINAPETHPAHCEHEAQLGRAATHRLQALLSEGPFELVRDGPDRGRYGRLLRIVTRGGQSLGAKLVAEGLAETWTGRRRDWCG